MPQFLAGSTTGDLTPASPKMLKARIKNCAELPVGVMSAGGNPDGDMGTVTN